MESAENVLKNVPVVNLQTSCPAPLAELTFTSLKEAASLVLLAANNAMEPLALNATQGTALVLTDRASKTANSPARPVRTPTRLTASAAFMDLSLLEPLANLTSPAISTTVALIADRASDTF